MRKHLIIVITIFLFSCGKKGKEIILPANQTVSKTVEFSINPYQDYTNARFDSSTARIKLTVYKQFGNPFSEEVLWDTVFEKRALKQYMQLPQPFEIRKVFTGVDESKYRIGAGYTIEYTTTPFTFPTWFASGGLSEPGNTTYKVPIVL